jgi:hypothetical protein
MVRTLLLAAGLVISAHAGPAIGSPHKATPPAAPDTTDGTERSPPATEPRDGVQVEPPIHDRAVIDRAREIANRRGLRECVARADCVPSRRELARQLIRDVPRAAARRIVYSLPEFHELRELLNAAQATEPAR